MISQIWRRLRKKNTAFSLQKIKKSFHTSWRQLNSEQNVWKGFLKFCKLKAVFFYDAFFVGLHLHIWQKSSYIEDCISKNSNLILTSWVLNERSYSLWREMNLKTTLLYDFQVILAFGKSKTCFICEKLMHFHTWNLFLKKS